MTVLEIAAVVATALGGLIGLFVAFGRYFLGRMREQDAATRARVADLERRVTAQNLEIARLKIEADKVPSLSKQVESLTEVLDATQRRLDEAEERARRAQAENVMHQEQNADLRQRVRALEQDCTNRDQTIAAYERVFALIGAERAGEARAGADQPPETNEASEGAAGEEEHGTHS